MQLIHKLNILISVYAVTSQEWYNEKLSLSLGKKNYLVDASSPPQGKD